MLHTVKSGYQAPVPTFEMSSQTGAYFRGVRIFISQSIPPQLHATRKLHTFISTPMIYILGLEFIFLLISVQCYSFSTTRDTVNNRSTVSNSAHQCKAPGSFC